MRGPPVLRRTHLYDLHAAAGATFTPFGGYEMPVHYGSIKAEHMAVRNQAGLFDVSHMSNLAVEGPRAAAALGRVMPFDFAGLEEGKGKYSVMLRPDGTILDDTFTFRLQGDRFLLIPNAGMNEAVRAHIQHHTPEAQVRDESLDWAILALQGPSARGLLEEATGEKGPRFHRIQPMQVGGAATLVSGTGYTGEKGVEIYVDARQAPLVWESLLQEPAVPAGLGARDTLRLEKGYCLAGHEFAGGRTPLEAGLGWAVDMESGCIGMDAVRAQLDRSHPVLWGLTLDKGIPRQGQRVRRDATPCGTVTSGTLSPCLGKGIALAYLDDAEAGQGLEVDVRGRDHPATVVKPPFV